ncbi:MAG: acyl-CoA synthetase [Gammaproteobacteria bacterium]|nr:MAG: acyl-CoA synthetase [Gammaproteobacteria bacterium]|tara:strand:+ start:935 stop:2473 length:1539 start_codon:yes stop_codon:yes gene_type:complete
MHPGVNGKKFPDKPAIVMLSSGKIVTHGELNDLSNQGAQLFRSLGLKPGDSIAFMLENHHLFFPIAFAAWRSGLRYTAISWRLQPAEVEYIVKDCEAKVFITSKFLEETAANLEEVLGGVKKFMLDGTSSGYNSYEESIASMPEEPVEDECQGGSMLYSSGTTGRPKGIYRELQLNPLPYTQEEDDLGLGRVVEGVYGGDENTVYLSPAPLYHSAPLGFNTGFLSLGGTSIVMEKFDPEAALKAIQDYKVTHSQWVPTMFVRFLKTDESLRSAYDLSSHKVAIHAAAPCPIEIKENMINWWGPILFEYYAGTEFNGMTIVNSEEWMEHKGTVGRPLVGELHILDDEGNEVPSGETGGIYFGGETATSFEYHNDQEKTQSAISKEGYSTLGDIGYVDDEGYLYLTDRKAFMIISGGVNIYPKETEDALIMHPKVADVAVFGVPHPEMGEEVKAVVQPANMSDIGEDLEAELIAFCKEKISHVKCPRSVDFEEELPRHPTGKLYKRLLKDRYWK